MTTDVVSKLWGFCHTRCHDGVDYGDYIEQIAYLLFLKMADERRIDLTGIEVRGTRGKVEMLERSWPKLAEQSSTDLTADRLPQAILSKAFAGELVPTEAELARAEGRAYETAEELLRRVQGEKPEAPAKKARERAAKARTA
jgi:hypothetical protein